MNRIFGVLLLLVALGFFSAMLVLFLVPKTFASTATIRVPLSGQPNATVMEMLKSDATLLEVITHLGLAKKWAERFREKQELRPDVCVVILKGMVRVRPVGGTELLAITVTSDDKHEAAEIANEMARTRIAAATETNSSVARTGGRMEIVERAEPSIRPVRNSPPRALWFGLTAFVSLGAGLTLLFRKPR